MSATPTEYKVVLYIEFRSDVTPAVQTFATGVRISIGKLYWTPIDEEGARGAETSVELVTIKYMDCLDA